MEAIAGTFLGSGHYEGMISPGGDIGPGRGGMARVPEAGCGLLSGGTGQEGPSRLRGHEAGARTGEVR